MRIRRPLPSTFVCRSLVDVRFGGGFLLVDEPDRFGSGEGGDGDGDGVGSFVGCCFSRVSRSCSGKLGLLLLLPSMII